jgi:23S rRNA (uracil1939-C5)-methyltransferase
MTALKIERVGAQGDGVASTASGPVFVPFTLPGEVVNVAADGQHGAVMAILEPSPDRVPPACKHFEHCGGCALQHWAPSSYLAWKREAVVEALRSKGIGFPVDPTVPCSPGQRRRLTFTARSIHGKIKLGFNAARSHEIVEIEECPIAMPELVAVLPALRRLAQVVVTKSEPVHFPVTRTDTGIDVSVDGVPAPKGEARKRVAEMALVNKWARLSVGGEIILEPFKPQVRFGKAIVTPAPGGFLQAVRDIEGEMAKLVCGHLAKSKRVADLFAGAGAFTFRLAETSAVHAVEGDAAAVASLDQGWRHVQGLKPVTVERRDLFRRPLTVQELKAFDAVVFDPPRAGAEAQCVQLAKSGVRRIAAVSCNPLTLARDLRILLDGGFKLVSVTPFDQFLWSPHVEAVALLER